LHCDARHGDISSMMLTQTQQELADGSEELTVSDRVLLRVRELRKAFVVGRDALGRPKQLLHAVRGVSFSLSRSETLGLVGESGCGKTTLSRLILQLVRPDGGSVHLGDSPDLCRLSARHLRPWRRRLQMIFQDPYSSLNPRMTVGAIVAEPLVIHGLCSRRDRRDRVRALLAEVGIPPHAANRYPHEFSGGQRQRVGIARALAAGPDVIIADEPVSALDVSIRSQIINLLERLQDERRLAYLFVSHDLSVVAHISHRVAVMYLGEFVELASKDALFSTPLHPYTQALLAAVPQPDPRHKRSRIVLPGDVPSPVAPPGGCPFHPRCPRCFAPCTVRPPRMIEAAENHFVACHLYDPQHS
jgi:oligopeptide/dipeptide ABC transporter ATP-binding protein